MDRAAASVQDPSTAAPCRNPVLCCCWAAEWLGWSRFVAAGPSRSKSLTTGSRTRPQTGRVLVVLTFNCVGSPPCNGTPPLKPGESGDTQESVKVTPGPPGFHEDLTPNPDGTFTDTLTVTSATKVNVSGTDGIRIPQPSDPPSASDDQLLDHEKGHAALDRNSFARDAQKKIEEAFKGLNGKKFKGTGATAAAAVAAAREALGKDINARADTATKDIIKQSTVLGDKYDDLTNKGRNDKGKIDSAQKGVDAALAERDKAPQAGSAPVLLILPNLARPRRQTPRRFRTTPALVRSRSAAI